MRVRGWGQWDTSAISKGNIRCDSVCERDIVGVFAYMSECVWTHVLGQVSPYFT